MRKTIYAFVAFFFYNTLFAQLPQLSLYLVKQGFNKPLDIKHCGDDRLFIVEQPGIIRIMSKDGNIYPTPFLDITSQVLSSGNEQGLLGLAFSPNYKEDGYFYVNYTTAPSPGTTVISRFSVNPADSNEADAGSEEVLLTFNQPYSNHNGGNMMFGKDGYLYISVGDGGSQNDPQNNGQNVNTLLGKLLRIDVTDQSPYAIPVDNPFAGNPNAMEEIWAYGLRNPWRCSVDRLTGDIWIADVGQNVYEEINFQDVNSIGGENYGWRCREGASACGTCNTSGCSGLTFTDPVFQYAHSNFSSCSVTGGYVYRGAQYSKLFGRYIFTDYCSGQFWSIVRLPNGTFDPDTLQDFANNQFTSFGEDNNGELYVTYRGSTSNNGRIYRITETSDCKPVAFITFDDTVSGCAPVKLTALRGDTLSYQWFNSAGAINGATGYEFNATQSGWYKVQVSKAQAGCQSMSDSVYVKVNDTTALSIAPVSLQYCINQAPIAIHTHVSPAGGTLSGSGISGNTIVPSLAGLGTKIITYTYTNNFGCVSTVTFPVLINDTTALTVPNSTVKYCIKEGTVSVNGLVLPQGGTYFSPFVNNDTLLNLTAAGVGNTVLQYQYNNNSGCTSHAIVNAEIGDSTALIVDSANVTVCINGNAFPLAGFVSPAGGTYSGSGVAGNVFTPPTTPGVASINYDFQNSYGCNSSVIFTITVAVCSGLNAVAQKENVQLLPNPAHDFFNLIIESNYQQNVNVQITDLNGKVCFNDILLLSNDVTHHRINVPDLSKGIYAVFVKANESVYVRRLVVE